MEHSGSIRNFRFYTPQQMQQMKDDLQIQADLRTLSLCAAYYRTQERRDPYIEELRFLTLAQSVSLARPERLAPTELLTNDAFVAATYADMMQKRAELSPLSNTPCSLGEAFSLASMYLCASGKENNPINSAFLLREKAPHLSKAENGRTLTTHDTCFSLRPTAPHKPYAQDTDIFLLLLPDADPHMGYCAIDALFDCEDLMREIVSMREIDGRGLLWTALDMTDGLYLDLPLFARHGEPIPLSTAITAYRTDLLLRIPANRAATFCEAIRPAGIRALQIGHVTPEARVTVRGCFTPVFSFATAFLRSLLPLQTVSVKLADEDPTAPFCGSHQLQHAPLPSNAEVDRSTEVYAYGNVLCAVACAMLTQSPFLQTVYTALAPILTLAASGCSFDAQRLLIGLEIPSDPRVSSLAVSTVLGLYRLQAELAIPALSHRILPSQRSSPTVTAFSVANGVQIPSHFAEEGNRMYCLAPDLQANGLPDFEALRAMLRYLTMLAQSKTLKSARVLLGESVTDGLQAMMTDSLYCRFTGKALLSPVLPIAVLVEASNAISACLAGEVCKRISTVV